MADLLKVEDLEVAKKHDTFHSEVITGKEGGLPTGADIDYATNAATGQVQKTLPKTIDEIKWSYVGLFADGVTFNGRQDFAVDDNGVQWRYTGALPFTAAPGTIPTEPSYQVIQAAKIFVGTIADLEASSFRDGELVLTKWVDSVRANGGLFEIITAAEAVSRGLTLGYTITDGIFSGEAFTIANGNVAVVNDSLFGFQQALLSEAGIVPSGNPDKVGASQYLDSLISLFVRSQDRVVLVDQTYGGDLKAALTAATDGTILILGPNTYNLVGYYVYDTQTFPDTSTWKGNEVRNLKIIGARMPEYAADGSRFVDGSGTVIQGTLLNWVDGFECYNLGIDCGDYVVDSLSGGKYLEGFIPSTQKDFSDTAAEPEKYAKDIHFGNIKTLLKTPTASSDTFKHSILFEHCFGGSYHGYIECKGGYHGFVIKSQHITGTTKPFVRGTVGTSYILKSDQWTECKHLALAGFKVGTEQDIQTAPALYEARDGISMAAISIGEIIGVNCKELLAPAGTDRITDITIGSISGSLMTGANGMYINNQFDRVKIGTHNFVNCVNGVVTQAGCTQIDIGSGSVRVASSQGYDLAGDVTHGNISGYEMTNYVVKNSGYVPNPELITGDGSGIGLLDSLFTVGIAYDGAWNTSGFYPLIVNAWGGKLTFRGFVNAAADNGAGSMFTLPANLRPKRQEIFFVPMLISGVWTSGFSVAFNPDGTVKIDPAADGTVTDVVMTGIELRYNV